MRSMSQFSATSSLWQEVVLELCFMGMGIGIGIRVNESRSSNIGVFFFAVSTRTALAQSH